MSMVQFRDVSKSYGSVEVLSKLDLDIQQGEFLTLLGPSGSGKTTLLNIISGMVVPSSGSVHIGGRDVTHIPPRSRDLGMVFQNYALMPHMTVFDNIAFPLRIRKLAAELIETKVMNILEVVQLEEFALRKPKELSGGQQQRVSIARCLVYEPALILMDEPLGALDKKLRDQLQLEIKKIHSEIGVTILYVTHDQDEALVLSDRICIMNRGKIEQMGSSHELYCRPKTEFVADFLGESNLIPARVSSVDSEQITAATHNQIPIIAKNYGGIVADKDTKILVRPESLRVTKSAMTAANSLEGTVLNCIFSGEASRYYIQCGDKLTLTAKQYNHTGTQLLEKGERVFASWDMADCCAIQ